MSLLLTFMELDKLYESKQWLDRETIINSIKNTGRWNYKFNKYSDKQLYRILERIQKEAEESAAMREYQNLSTTNSTRTCQECGALLSDGGSCPVCDDGEEAYFQDNSLLEWLDSNGNSVNISSATQTTNSTQANAVAQPPKASTQSANIVTIVYDYSKHKLRAQADDGVNGIGNVAFPTNLRTKAGQQYKVDKLIWNGKNYRVTGSIIPI